MTEYDASNRRHIDLANREAKAQDESRAAFMAHIMGLVDGRAYIYDLLIKCHAFGTPYANNAWSTAFNCGIHTVGQWLLVDIMAHCPDDYIKMMREANARSIANDSRRSRSDKDSNGDDSRSKPYVHPSGDDSPPAADSEYNPFADDGGQG